MSDQMKDECPTCGGLPPGEASGAGDLCYCTPDDASREAATRMSVRGPSGTSEQPSSEYCDHGVWRGTACGDCEMDKLTADLAQAQRERDDARKDAAYHADCRPNRRQAEAAIADAKAMNDKWADEVAARREAEQQLSDLRTAIAQIVDEMTPKCLDPVVHGGLVFNWRDRLVALGGQP